MAVHARPAMPGHVLDDRRDAAGKQSVGDRPAHRRHALGPGREGPRADGVVHAFARDIEHRRAVDLDSDFVEIMRDQARDETGRRLGFGRLKPGLDRRGGRIGAPVRRRHPLHPAALLIDQHGRVGAADAVAERSRQRAQLLAVGDVALEQDQAPGILPAQEGAFLVIEREAGAAADEGLGHSRLRASLEQDTFGPSRHRKEADAAIQR